MKHIFTPILLLTSITLFAQVTISGKVSDEKGEPIPGANVVVRDSYDGASSAVDGTFSFTTEETGPHFIDITFVGYKALQQQIDITDAPIALSITLKEEINQLDAVVISAGSF